MPGTASYEVLHRHTEMSVQLQQIEAHRPAITGHCYRMLGSAVDATDASQETIIRAWKSLDHFDGRASMRTWLYRIATNVCLDEIAKRGRRARPMEEGPPAWSGSPSPELLVQKPRTHWLEPIADASAIDPTASPAERAIMRQSIRLAFVSALQRLAPKQRAVLLLMEVLGWSAAEVAATLDTTIPAVNSALQRARDAVSSQNEESLELSASQQEMLDQYVAAFEGYDIEQLVSLLKKDAAFSMPPYQLWFQGREAVRNWMLGMGAGCRGSRLIATAACGSPAFGQYRGNPQWGHKAWAIIVLELSGDQISGVNSFLDTETLFPLFHLPMELP
jgi:RNA polymerase sigma-70 factor, ECF subfamily